MTTKKLTKPKLISDALKILDLSDRRTRHLAQHRQLGKTRRPTAEEQARFNLPYNTIVICDMAAVQRCKQRRDKAAMRAEIARDRKGRRKARKRGRR